MKLFIACLIAENNSFSPIPTGLGAFEAEGVRRGGCTQIDPFGMGPALQAARDTAEAAGWQVVEGLCAAAQPLGPVVQGVYEALRDEILSDLDASLPVEGVVLLLHGAMMAEACEDCEGDLLSRVRAIIGPGVPIGVELDLHCHFTRQMRANADIFVAYKEYPHTDIEEQAAGVVRLTMATALGHIRPCIGLHDCGMRAGVWPTVRDPLKSFISRLRSLEGSSGVLSISLAHGFDFGDATEAGTKLWVIGDADETAAQALADQLGQEFRALGMEKMPPPLGVDAALDRALAATRWPVALADNADNPGGGAMGDSTFILRRIVERGILSVALGGIWDPGAVQICMEAGPGARLTLRVGGKSGVFAGDPLDVTVRCRAVRPDHFQTGLGSRVALGPAAWITIGEDLDVVLMTKRQQVLGMDLFTNLGIDLAGKRIVVVKSMQHYYADFRSILADAIAVDTPGLLRYDTTALPFKRRQGLLF